MVARRPRRPAGLPGRLGRASQPRFGAYIRARREGRLKTDRRFSLRQVARRIGVQPAYLSQVERGNVAPPSEATTRRLATDLGEDPDVLLALAGKVSEDLQEVIRRRPAVFAELLRSLRAAPTHAVLRVVREVRDGKW
jgi:transcriptional regulator with XRE-family HTH domain